VYAGLVSGTLYWEPSKRKKNPVGGNAVNQLRDLLMARQKLDRRDIKYLEGLRDAGLSCAQELLDAVEKYDEITLSVEY
jgi:hypothetical protein